MGMKRRGWVYLRIWKSVYLTCQLSGFRWLSAKCRVIMLKLYVDCAFLLLTKVALFISHNFMNIRIVVVKTSVMLFYFLFFYKIVRQNSVC